MYLLSKCLPTYCFDYEAQKETNRCAAELLNSVEKRLTEGDAIELVVRDLTVAGIDRDVAMIMVDSLSGESHHECPNCALTYVESVTICPECEHPLTINVE